MADHGYHHVNRSAEWRKWTAHYKALGCAQLKVERLVHRKMRKY